MAPGINRPPVPAELERQIKTEAGHRCAIPTCRQWPVELAHIIPFRIVKNHSFDNLIALCPTCHTRYDNSKDIDLASMRDYKARLRTMDFAEPEEYTPQSSKLNPDSQKEVGPFSHFPLLNEWFNKLSKHEQLQFNQTTLMSIATFLAILHLGIGLEVYDGNLLAAIITPGMIIVFFLLLLFFIRREYRE